VGSRGLAKNKMNESPRPNSATTTPERSAYGTDCSVTDYILGITFEIWEEGRVNEILRYYSEDCPVFGLDGIVQGAGRMVEQTKATLDAFPDRLLIGDDVIWSGTVTKGFSSHRVLSPMTNLGDTVFGPATRRSVRVMNMADCEITDGQITREWLVRDNLALVRQLGFEAVEAARSMATRFDGPLTDWLQAEYARVADAPSALGQRLGSHQEAGDADFARQVLTNCWVGGNRQRLEAVYAPYCVLHRAPVRICSGRAGIMAHYDAWRGVLPDAKIAVDHVCSQPFGADGRHIAARWAVAGTQQEVFAACPARGQPLFILGVTHWRVLAGRIISEWTVFDELALMAQSLSGNG
jgi:predicted ester cyclase